MTRILSTWMFAMSTNGPYQAEQLRIKITATFESVTKAPPKVLC
jgi:hypothetical protein